MAVFLITLGDHSAVPNVYVLSMIAAAGKGLNPYVLYATAALSITLYEHTLFWMGRFMSNHEVIQSRVIRWVARSAAVATKVMSGRPTVWMLFGRFVAYAGLYVPFAYGQMRRRYVGFCLWSAVGTLLHLGAFGVPTYILGMRFERVVQRVPIGFISLAFMVAVAVPMAVHYARKRHRARVAP
jgi:membrane protein DedA with SNARE-associated domain